MPVFLQRSLRPFRPFLLALPVLALTALSALTAAAFAFQGGEPASPELPSKYRTWLEDTAVLASPKEREAFLALERDYQRDAFIRRFWEVRDPFPQTARNELQEKWTERVKVARERYGNLTEDRARMLLINGVPAQVLQSRCSELLLPVEIWSWPGTERIRGDFSLTFVSPGTAQGPWRLWHPTEGVHSLLALEMRMKTSEGAGFTAISELCPQGDEIASRLAESLDWQQVEAKVKPIPNPGVEWLSSFSSYSTEVPEGAPSFPAQMEVSFPGRYGNRTVVQGLVSVPRGEVKPERLEGSSVATYSFLVDGEVLYKDSLFEHFRYRFTLPEGDVRTEQIPVVFQRFLRPGSYTLVLKIEDLGGKRYYRELRELEVPAVEGVEAAAAAPPVPAEPAAPNAPAPAPQVAFAEANTAMGGGSGEQTIRILPPLPGLVTGRARVEAVTTGEGISKVSFELNGRPILAKSKPPFSVELNLGTQPRIHIVKAFALGASGERLAEDEVLLNAGPHRFSVRLVDPQPGRTYQSSLRAQALVDVPEGETLDRVELYLDESLVATLYQPPFTQPLLLPPGRGVTYVRVVAYLKDGNSTEDLVLVNAPDFTEELKVQFVELFTTVVDGKGRPVAGLNKNDFKVSEDGAEQQVLRFELVKDVPIYAGILLDTSGSMGEGDKLDAAVKGALQFFQTVIQPKDRATVITFSDQPNLAVRFTNQEPLLAGGLAGLKPDGNTALYDSLIYALHYFGGIKGKRAIILLSDGRDEGSRYTYNDTLEYARRSGVALYTVGISLASRDTDVRLKLNQLAEETGGRAFFIDRAGALAEVYKSIESEVRSQYLLAYQSSKSGNEEKFRTVEVKLAKPGLEAKTLRGYYP